MYEVRGTPAKCAPVAPWIGPCGPATFALYSVIVTLFRKRSIIVVFYTTVYDMHIHTEKKKFKLSPR